MFFTAQNVRIGGLPDGHGGPVMLGFRAEDSEIVEDGGAIWAKVYSIELLGDSTMVTMKAGGAVVSVKAAKDFRAEIGDSVRARVPAAICHLFDAATGKTD